MRVRLVERESERKGNGDNVINISEGREEKGVTFEIG